MQNPQFFRVTPPDAPLAQSRLRGRLPPTRSLVILGSLSVGLVFLGVWGWNAWQSSRELTPREKAIQALEERRSACSSDDVNCLRSATADVARETGVGDVCVGLEGGEYSSCISLAAKSARSTTLCDSLMGEEDKNSCRDGVILARANAGDLMTLCASASRESVRYACEGLITQRAIREGNCVAYGVPEEACTTQMRIESILASGSPSACAELPSEERATCQDLFASRDSDTDGLSAEQEARYGTSDTMQDTDGDGVFDGDEVAAGQNPLQP